MSKIHRYTEDQAAEAGFNSDQIAASRAHPEGYIGTDKEGKMSFNTQAEISMGGFEASGRGARAALPQMQGEGYPPAYRRNKE